jgi:hypothetical protein
VKIQFNNKSQLWSAVAILLDEEKVSIAMAGNHIIVNQDDIRALRRKPINKSHYPALLLDAINLA